MITVLSLAFLDSSTVWPVLGIDETGDRDTTFHFTCNPALQDSVHVLFLRAQGWDCRYWDVRILRCQIDAGKSWNLCSILLKRILSGPQELEHGSFFLAVRSQTPEATAHLKSHIESHKTWWTSVPICILSWQQRSTYCMLMFSCLVFVSCLLVSSLYILSYWSYHCDSLCFYIHVQETLTWWPTSLNRSSTPISVSHTPSIWAWPRGPTSIATPQDFLHSLKHPKIPNLLVFFFEKIVSWFMIKKNNVKQCQSRHIFCHMVSKKE